MVRYKIRIVFERIRNDLVKGYEILRNTEHIDQLAGIHQVNQRRTAYIEDPGRVNPVKISQRKLETDETFAHTGMGSMMYKIPHRQLVIDSAHPLVVWGRLYGC